MTGTRRSTMSVNKRRKGTLSFVMPWLRRFGIALLIAVLGFVGGAWFLISGSLEKTNKWLAGEVAEAGAGMGFTVNNIIVEGRVYTDATSLKAAINADKGSPLFAFNPDETRKELRKINWVRNVRVERRLPDTIYVELTEKKPLALWQVKNKLQLLDEEGQPVTSENLGRFGNLLIVMGDEAPAHTPELIKNLTAEPRISSQLKAAKWVDARRWDLVFKNGITAKMPEGETGLALRKLGDAIEKDGLLQKNIVSVDLREEGRMIVETAPGAVQAWQASAKTGGKSI